jgi:hypothetical protein
MFSIRKLSSFQTDSNATVASIRAVETMFK